MNILFLTLSDFDNFDAQSIYTDLMEEFLLHNHKLWIISPIERKSGRETEVIKIGENCSILKLRIGNIQKTNLLEKGISTLLIEKKFINGIKKHFDQITFDFVLYPTPPVTFGKVVQYIKKRDKALSYLLLKDIFPQNAVDLGKIKENGLIYKYFRKKEQRLYQVSDFIGTLSEGNRQYLLTHNSFINSETVEVNPNSIKVKQKLSTTLISSKRKEILEKYQIPDDKVIYLYGGNLGEPQGIDFLLEIIRKDESRDIFFLIVGSGTQYRKIEAFLAEKSIENAKIMSVLPKDEYQWLEQIADVGMIFLDSRFTIPNIPSRMLGYMQAGKPILAATDKHTDLKDILQQGNFGLWSPHGDYKAFEGNMKSLLNEDNRNELGGNAYSFLKENYDVASSYHKINNKTFRKKDS